MNCIDSGKLFKCRQSLTDIYIYKYNMKYQPFYVHMHMVHIVDSGTCNFFQVTGQRATLKWSRGPDNVTRVNEG